MTWRLPDRPRLERRHQDAVHLGSRDAPEQVADLLDGYGWQVLEDLGSDEYRARYLEPSGRKSAVTDLEHVVSARKR